MVIEFLKFPPIKEFTRYKKLNQLNITYLPIKKTIEKKVNRYINKGNLELAADLILTHYDYTRARVMLSSLEDTYREGPYIISFLKPHNWKSEIKRPYLFQDQSN